MPVEHDGSCRYPTGDPERIFFEPPSRGNAFELLTESSRIFA
jgi:hypothetical protein